MTQGFTGGFHGSMLYQRGDRVVLVRTMDEFTRLEPGALGTVNLVDDLGTIHVDWDGGTKLGIVLDAGDVIRKVA